jgi:predicted DNA-binding transcriptional regulator YafY
MRFAGRFARILQTDPPDADGWIKVTLRFDVEEMAIGYALSFGEKLEVLEPRTLRTKVIEEARNLIRFYEDK